MNLKLYMVHIIGGPVLLKNFDISKQDIEECFYSNNFALFSSTADIDHWEGYFESKNKDYSYILLDVTTNATVDKLRGFFDIKMKDGKDILRLIKSFSTIKEDEVFQLTEEELEEKLDIILTKIGKEGERSLNNEEKEFLKNYKQ